MTITALRERLQHPDPEVRAYWIGKTMRQAKPDDALDLIPPHAMRKQWKQVSRYLGDQRSFWEWLLFEQWRGSGRDG